MASIVLVYIELISDANLVLNHMTLASQARQKSRGVREAVHSKEARHYKEPCFHHWHQSIGLQLQLSALKFCFGTGNVFQSTLHMPQSDTSPALRKTPRYGGKKFSVAGTACISSNEEAEAGGWILSLRSSSVTYQETGKIR